MEDARPNTPADSEHGRLNGDAVEGAAGKGQANAGSMPCMPAGVLVRVVQRRRCRRRHRVMFLVGCRRGREAKKGCTGCFCFRVLIRKTALAPRNALRPRWRRLDSALACHQRRFETRSVAKRQERVSPPPQRRCCRGLGPRCISAMRLLAPHPHLVCSPFCLVLSVSRRGCSAPVFSYPEARRFLAGRPPCRPQPASLPPLPTRPPFFTYPRFRFPPPPLRACVCVCVCA